MQKETMVLLNQINMEQNSELVSIGKVLDENSYKNEEKGIFD